MRWGQVISLRTVNPLPVERIPRAVNYLLPATIRVRHAGEQPELFHARWSACSRRYWYRVQTARWNDPFRGRYCWQVPQALDSGAMAQALQPLLGAT